MTEGNADRGGRVAHRLDLGAGGSGAPGYLADALPCGNRAYG